MKYPLRNGGLWQEPGHQKATSRKSRLVENVRASRCLASLNSMMEILIIWNAMASLMEAQNRFYVYRLPSYSPDKNPIEKLWKNTKRDATHLKYFPTFENFRSAVIRAFNKYLYDASKIICVMKQLRAEAGIV